MIAFSGMSKEAKGFLLATMSGLCTLLGAMTVYFPVPKNKMRLASCFCLAAASGVMCYVSLVEVFHESQSNFEAGFAKRVRRNKFNHKQIKSCQNIVKQIVLF